VNVEEALTVAGKQEEKGSIDIYSLLLGASKKQKRDQRQRLLDSLGVKEFFEEGSIKIDMKTCKGVECKFCINACPTNALYWKAGEVAVAEDLCIYCTSCVLNCMVPDCMEVRRKRQNGENEHFSNPKEVVKMSEHLNTTKRTKVIEELLPDDEAYLKRYRKPTSES
jgi:Fe-S-cluster-containing hydrogenase component 2